MIKQPQGLDLRNDNNIGQQKSTMTMNNNNDHYVPGNHPNESVDRFHVIKNSIPDSQQASSDHNEEHLWDTYSNKLSSTQTSPVASSRWSFHDQTDCMDFFFDYTGLIASLVREQGNIYSLAAVGDMLYTGSDSKNIRVWKNRKEFSGFKSTSGLVKAIVIANNKIFTGHRDGKIRVWRASSRNPVDYRRIGTLPNWTSVMKKSMQPKNYTEVRKNHNAIWIKHFDVISSLSLSEDNLLLYSGSWDKTIKVWNALDFKCLESIPAHDDAVNAVVTGFDDMVFSGSADGAVKVWRREMSGKRTKHSFLHTILNQDSAVTSLIVNPTRTTVYAGLSDGLTHFWERDKLLSGGSGTVFKCHRLAVLCLAVAGSLVFSGSADTNIHVWRREDDGEHKCMHVLSGHSGPVKCLAVDTSHNNEDRPWTTLYSGSLDKSVKIWRVSTKMNDRKDEEESPSTSPPLLKLKDRLWRSYNGGFQSFTIDQGRLSQGRN